MSTQKGAKKPSPADEDVKLAAEAEVKLFLRKVQGLTGIGFGFFITLHFISTVMGAFGPEVYNETLNTFRKVYQNPIIEIGIIFCTLTHMIAGAQLHWRRDKFGWAASPPAPWYSKLQRHSGSILAALIFVHVSGTRLPSFLGQNRPDDFDHLHVMVKLAPEFSFIYFVTYSMLALVHIMLSLPQVLELFHILPTGSHRRMATSPIMWFVIVAIESSLIAGMWGFYTFPASKAGIEYWLPIITANVPPAVVTGSL